MRTSTWITIIGIAIAAFVIGIISGFIPIKTEPKKPTQTEQQIAELSEQLAQTKEQLNELSENYIYNTVDTISGAITDFNGFDLYINDDDQYRLQYEIYYDRVTTDGDELDYQYNQEYGGYIDFTDFSIPSEIAEIEENENDHYLYINDDYTKARIRSGLPIQVSSYEVFGEDFENEVILYLVGVSDPYYCYAVSERWISKAYNTAIPSEVFYELVIYESGSTFRIDQIYANTTAIYYAHHISFDIEITIGSDRYESTIYFDYFSTDRSRLTQMQDIDFSVDNYGSIENCRICPLYDCFTGIESTDQVISFLNYQNGTINLIVYDFEYQTSYLEQISNAEDYILSDTVELIQNYT